MKTYYPEHPVWQNFWCAVLALLIFFVVSNSVFGLDLNPDELRSSPTNKAKVSVLQDRFFQKALRPEIGLMAGTFLNEAYTKTATSGFRAGLFFNEWFGAEFQMLRTSVKDSEDRRALNDLKYRDLKKNDVVSPDPEINPIYGVTDYNGVIAPFYGKLNFFDQFIVYSDVYLTGGYSKVETEQGELKAYSVGIGQRFYMLQSLSLRIDFRDRIYNEIRDEKETRKDAYSIDLGISYFFF